MEQQLLKRVQRLRDRSVLSMELSNIHGGGAFLYHLTPFRSNLLRPLAPLLQGACVLELGGDCGALTRYLGETCAKVAMVEENAHHAAIAAARCQGLYNTRVYCDSLHNAAVPGAPFDVVTLIEGLKNVRLYDRDSTDPVLALLEKAAFLLKPEGILVLALENQLGLKYYAGDKEDHSGQPMFGIDNCYADDGIATFGVHEIKRLLHKAGFVSHDQYLPIPEYTFPMSVIHPEARGIPPEAFDLGTLLQESLLLGAANCTRTFSMQRNWPVVARNDLAWDLCNSVYFVARKAPLAQTDERGESVIASHYGTIRPLEFYKETQFVRTPDGIVVRRRTLGQARKTQGQLQQTFAEEEPYYPYPKYMDQLMRIVNIKGWSVEQVVAWYRPIFLTMQRSIVEKDGQAYLPSGMIDRIGRNTLVDPSGNILFIDQEWYLADDLQPLQLIVLYGIFVTLDSLGDVAAPGPGVPLGVMELSRKVLTLLGYPSSQELENTFYAWRSKIFSTPSTPDTTELTIRRSPHEYIDALNEWGQKVHEIIQQRDTLRAAQETLQGCFEALQQESTTNPALKQALNQALKHCAAKLKAKKGPPLLG